MEPGVLGYYMGLPMIPMKTLTKGTLSVPKRRNKQKRIQKKWIMKYGFNYIPIPDTQIYVFDNKIIGHPITLKKILKAFHHEKY
jgi:hypothetical protein